MLRDIAVVRNRKKMNGERLKKHRVALEYWDFENNLGDFLAPVIVAWMLAQKGMNLQTTCAGKKHLMAVGSILGLGRFDAVVWGSGVNSFENAAHVTEQKKYRKYDVRALRGPVSRQVMTANGYDCPEIYGDPAILMPLIYPGERKKGEVFEITVLIAVHRLVVHGTMSLDHQKRRFLENIMVFYCTVQSVSPFF